jgi:PTH1 family peptidyl-tRNA hydrolase
MHLIIGLGNVGVKYEKTRHNFGFLLLDQILENYGFEAKGEKFRSNLFVGEIKGIKTLAIKPKTFMNLSGKAAEEIAQFYKIPLTNILVLHDDVDLAFGKIKYKVGGGSGGHNGLKSLDETIGKDYMRLRLGVGRPENKEFDTADYVLGKFSDEEMKGLEVVNKKISADLDLILKGRANDFLNKFFLV